MKLRNKKTGDVTKVDHISIPYRHNDSICSSWITSIAQLNEEWEDYAPQEPLIKDEKIRKAVRAWAELCGIDRCHFEHNEGSLASKWYSISLPTSKHGEDIESGFYTIAELCGEEEE